MKYPTVEMLWYPSATCTNLSWYYQLNIFLWHLLPAYMIDFLFRTLAGKRRKWVIVSFYCNSVGNWIIYHIYFVGFLVPESFPSHFKFWLFFQATVVVCWWEFSQIMGYVIRNGSETVLLWCKSHQLECLFRNLCAWSEAIYSQRRS